MNKTLSYLPEIVEEISWYNFGAIKFRTLFSPIGKKGEHFQCHEQFGGSGGFVHLFG